MPCHAAGPGADQIRGSRARVRFGSIGTVKSHEADWAERGGGGARRGLRFRREGNEAIGMGKRDSTRPEPMTK